MIGGATWIVAATQGTIPAAQQGPSGAAPIFSRPNLLPSGAPSAVPSGSAKPKKKPSASAKATPATKPGQGTANRPSAPKSRGSFPSEASTGPSGGSLKLTTKTIRVMKAGTVIDGVDMRADISVEADNVTIKNSRLIVSGEWAIIQREGASGLTVQDTEIRGDGSNRLQHAVFNQGGDIKILRNDMSICSDPISTSQGLIQDNYLHDPKYFDGDHTDMIQSNSGSSSQLVIRHNTIINTLDQTAAVALFQDFGVQRNALIENNLMAGGGYSFYGGAGKMGTATNIKVIDNVFSTEVHKNGGAYGPVAYWDKNGSGNVWENNTWAETGKAVSPN